MLPTFKKNENGTPPVSSVGSSAPLGTRAAPSPLRAPSFSGAPSVIGPDLLITGNLVSKGEVQVDGEVQGDIHGTHIVIGERAKITGTIIAEEVVVRGHVMGSVRGKRVLLQNGSHVEGDIYHQTLAIEQGAFFEGKSRRTEDPISALGLAPSRHQPESAAPQSSMQPGPMPVPN